MKKSENKVLVVGQGIAGSVLAIRLIQKGYSVTVIDNGHLSAASRVAAGMWNPLSFKKLNTPWHSKLFLEAATQTFTEFEKLLGISIFHIKDLIRIFPDQYAANEWDERCEINDVKHFASPDIVPSDPTHFIAPHGMGLAKYAGWCNIPVFLDAAKNFIRQNSTFLETQFNEKDLKRADNHWAYCHHSFDRVILAVGAKNIDSHYFNFVPVQPNKGQVLTLHSSEFTRKEIVNYGNFILPLGNHTFRLGSTYEFNDPNPNPTESSRNMMLDKLKSVTPIPFTLVEEKAGYRPTMPDRKPVIGRHPELEELYIFNGFGSKGVTYVPYFSSHFIDYLENGTPLMTDVSIERYYSKYTSVQYD